MSILNNFSLLVCLGFLASPSAFALSEIETILSPDSSQKLVKRLQRRGFKYKTRSQDNYYLDTDTMVLMHNGISLRIRIVSNSDAKLTLKISDQYLSHPLALKTDAEYVDTDKTEYVCGFATLSKARQVLRNVPSLLAMTDRDCEPTKGSFQETSPITILNERISRSMTLPSGEVTVAASELKIAASNKEVRHFFKVNFAEVNGTKMRIDQSSIGPYLRYSAELDVDHVESEVTQKAMQEVLEGHLDAVGSSLTEPQAGKRLTTLLVQKGLQAPLATLSAAKEIYPVAQ